MSRFITPSLIVSLLVLISTQGQTQRIKYVHDEQKQITTVLLPSTELSGPKDRYHSLAFTIYYFYPTKYPAPPEDVHFELHSVVKARLLSPDLYVVFVIDGKPVHFSSNRSAMRKPVPGKSWIGERIYFVIPREDFLKLAAAQKLNIKLGDVSFDFGEDQLEAVREMGTRINQ
jgi:hypothetical protein